MMQPSRIFRALKWHLITKWVSLARRRFNNYKEKNKSYPVIPKKAAYEIGKVLLTFVSAPHVEDYNVDLLRTHSNHWHSLMMVKILNEKGFSVDVTDWRNTKAPAGKSYDLVIGQGLAFMASCKRGGNTKKVYLGYGAYWDQAIAAEKKRIEALESRKGVKVRRRYRTYRETGPLYADYLFVHGSKWVESTYRAVVDIPMFELTNSVTEDVKVTLEDKNFESAKKNFLWFASFGAVHRGLDVLIEVFSELPDLHLWICGNVKYEQDFWSLYEYELTQLSNIHYIGWVDVTGDTFTRIISTCAFHIFPSASDGMPGAVVNTMSAGLIPIVTREAGMDTGQLGIQINCCQPLIIKRIVLEVSNLNTDQLRNEAIAVSDFALTRYSKEAFLESFKSNLEKVLREQR
jgi:glycosyltransferase involved in cell wall biosynthesis